MGTDSRDVVLDAIYQAALAPELLGHALERMTSYLDGDTCHLVGWERCSSIPALSMSVGLAADIGLDYATHYAQLDPRRRLAPTHPPGQPLNCSEHLDDRFVMRDEFFQDYVIPTIGVRYLLGSSDLLEESDYLILIEFQRHVGRDAFSATESGHLNSLLPHLRRALRLIVQSEKGRTDRRLLWAAVETSNVGTLALTEHGRVIWTNRRGEAMLRDGHWFTQTGGCLKGRNPDRDACLKMAIRGCAADKKPRSIYLGTNTSSDAQCCLTVLAHRTNDMPALPVHMADVIVLATTTEGYRVASIQQLKELFQLTAAESGLARALAHGESIDEYAQRERVKRSTVKTQLQAVFSKTSTNTQRDLVRLVVSLPALRE
jgi:DNA-binding CsgD family transcriptional regulator